jgi:serine/threonine protein phosphatase PrpC
VLHAPLARSFALRAYLIAQVESQGIQESDDATAAFYHDSTTPPNFYMAKGYANSNINMDRGGYGQCLDGTNCGSIFDGVSCGGMVNLFAAQAFAEAVTERVARSTDKFKQGEGVNEALAYKAFKEAASPLNNPGLQHSSSDAEGGAATGMFACVQPAGDGKQYCIVNGAGVGDCSAFVICGGNAAVSTVPKCELDAEETILQAARQLSTTAFRREGDARDTGGQLTMSLGIQGRIWSFSHPVGLNDIILLCTDGLTDNLYMPEAAVLIPLIASATYFDAIPIKAYDDALGPDAHCPRHAELATLIKSAPNTPPSRLFPKQVALRLRNYVKWVTQAEFHLEQTWYEAQLKIGIAMKELETARSRSKTRRRVAGLNNQSTPTQVNTPPRTPPPAIDACFAPFADGPQHIREEEELETEIEECEIQMANLLLLRESGLATKTDDVMILAMHPFHHRRKGCEEGWKE